VTMVFLCACMVLLCLIDVHVHGLRALIVFACTDGVGMCVCVNLRVFLHLCTCVHVCGMCSLRCVLADSHGQQRIAHETETLITMPLLVRALGFHKVFRRNRSNSHF